MFVESGAHPYYRADLSKSLDYALADLLLTRGEGKIDDRRFASEIEWGVPDQGLQGHVIGRLEHLALTEPAAVKAAKLPHVSNCGFTPKIASKEFATWPKTPLTQRVAFAG